jgi:hypothetical protein
MHCFVRLPIPLFSRDACVRRVVPAGLRAGQATPSARRSKRSAVTTHVRLRGAGNDFSTLYAPLIRDGRMEKYYWNPSREDRIGVCFGIFKDDSLDRSQARRVNVAWHVVHVLQSTRC